MAVIATSRRPAFVSTTVPFRSSFAGRSRNVSSLRPNQLNITNAHSRAVLLMKVGILFSTVTGNTDEVAQMVRQYFGDAADDPKDIGDVSPDEVAAYEAFVVGAPTWNTGADEERTGTNWDEFLYDGLTKVDLSGKPVAVFGLGDGVGYEENFCDAIEELHLAFEGRGAKMIGYTATEGVEFTESKAVKGDVFLGLPIDNSNHADETEEKVKEWVVQISKEASLFD